MASTVTRSEQAKLNTSYILEAVKKAPRSRKELMETLSISRPTLDRYIQTIRDEYPGIFVFKKEHGNTGRYFWLMDKAPVETPVKYDYKKTEEGYSDPTAAKAMENFEKSTGRFEYLPGEIYEYNNSNGSVEIVLVLAKVNSRATCLPIVKKFEEIWEIDIPEAKGLYWVDENGQLSSAYYLPSKITIKPTKYFGDKLSAVSNKTLNEIKTEIALYLDLPTNVEKEVEVPVEVEKIVEKVVEKEVPVETVKVVNAPVTTYAIDVDETTLKLLEQKASIYQDILEKLIAAKMV